MEPITVYQVGEWECPECFRMNRCESCPSGPLTCEGCDREFEIGTIIDVGV